jgi:flagellar basal-body rod protein FlgG
MSGLIESATAILGVSERRIEVAAHNVSNISTPGYKRQIGFSRLLATGDAPLSLAPDLAVARDFAQGALTRTSNPLDLAISGPGFFQLRTPDGMLYSRQGEFKLGADGILVTPQGYALQQAGGGDVVLDHASVTVGEDGTILDNGAPVARIGLFTAPEGVELSGVSENFFAAPEGAMEPASAGMVRQGMVENSNVAIGDEMVAMTAAVRQAETGARLVQIYDDLLGRAITSFGSVGR